jgi:cytochrome c553
MHPVKRNLILLLTLLTTTAWAATQEERLDLTLGAYEAARWHANHFQPAIDGTSDAQCLGCHQEILQRKVLQQSPAGVKASESLAWYQTLDTYDGPQETFHRRHLITPLATRLMDMKCTTCHQGNDTREEAPIPPTSGDAGFALRKMVSPKTCLMCHGQFGYEIMGLPGEWHEVSEVFGDSCLTCHSAIRTNRHQVNYLKAEAIEKAGQVSSDVCFGCHGGRAWYRNSYPYPRHSWPGMAEDIPDWAKDRPTVSEARFLSGLSDSSKSSAK